MRNERAILPEAEREAIRAEICRLYNEDNMSEAAIAKFVGISQQAVNRARRFATVGPSVARAIYERLNVTAAELIDRHNTSRKSIRHVTPSYASLPAQLDARQRLMGALPTQVLDNVDGRRYVDVHKMTTVDWLELYLNEYRLVQRLDFREAIKLGAPRARPKLPPR